MARRAPFGFGGRALGPAALLFGALLGGCSLIADFDRAAPEGLGGTDEGPVAADRGVIVDLARPSDAGLPDAQTDAAVFADAEPSRDALPTDAGADGGVDAAADAEPDAGPPPIEPTFPCSDDLAGIVVRLPCSNNPAIDRKWQCLASGEWRPEQTCAPRPPHWCGELCAGCSAPYNEGTLDRIRLADPPPPFTAPYPFDAILAVGGVKCDGCDARPLDAVLDQIYVRRFDLGGVEEIARDLVINCPGGDCTQPPVLTLRYVAYPPEPASGIPWRYRLATHRGTIPDEGPVEAPAEGLIPADLLQLIEWWLDGRGATAWRIWSPGAAQACVADGQPDGARLSSRCAPEADPPTAADPPRAPQVDDDRADTFSEQVLDADGISLVTTRSAGGDGTQERVVNLRVTYDFSCWHCPPDAEACVHRDGLADLKCQQWPGRSVYDGRRPFTVVCQAQIPAVAAATCAAAGGHLATLRDLDDLANLARLAPTESRTGDGDQVPALEPGHLVGGSMEEDLESLRWPGPGWIDLDLIDGLITDAGPNRCLVVLANGQLRAVPCDTSATFRFACEFIGAEGVLPGAR